MKEFGGSRFSLGPKNGQEAWLTQAQGQSSDLVLLQNY